MRSGTPVDPGAMPTSVAPSVTVGARISLQGDGTSIWRLVNFPSRDRTTITPTWVQSNHDRQEFAVRRGEIEKEVKNLPADLAKTVEDDVDVMAMVSIIEGPWSGKSPSWDVEASLGVFQWGAEKKTKATTSSSLGGFYKTLEDRSTAASKTAAKDRSLTDQFYVDTWKQVTDAGLSIAGGTLQIGGKAATGGEVETALEGPMGTGKLRAYQLVAAKDWLDDLRAKTVRPMTYGATLLHAGFSAAGPTIKDGDRSVRIDAPAWAATVGAVCTSKKALALMANLLVNRPAWVNTVVWRALAPDDVSTQASGLVTKLTAAQDAAEQAAASGRGHERHRRAPEARRSPRARPRRQGEADDHRGERRRRPGVQGTPGTGLPAGVGSIRTERAVRAVDDDRARDVPDREHQTDRRGARAAAGHDRRDRLMEARERSEDPTAGALPATDGRTAWRRGIRPRVAEDGRQPGRRRHHAPDGRPAQAVRRPLLPRRAGGRDRRRVRPARRHHARRCGQREDQGRDGRRRRPRHARRTAGDDGRQLGRGRSRPRGGCQPGQARPPRTGDRGGATRHEGRRPAHAGRPPPRHGRRRGTRHIGHARDGRSPRGRTRL